MIQIFLFLLIAAFAQSLEDPICGDNTFLNEMKICEEILADSGVDMRGEGDKIISEFLILFVPVIVIVIVIIKLMKKKKS